MPGNVPDGFHGVVTSGALRDLTHTAEKLKKLGELGDEPEATDLLEQIENLLDVVREIDQLVVQERCTPSRLVTSPTPSDSVQLQAVLNGIAKILEDCSDLDGQILESLKSLICSRLSDGYKYL